MNKVLLDTDILSEYFKGYDRNVATNARAYALNFTQFTFTSVTVYEIMLGLEAKGASAQAKMAAAWIERNEQIVPTKIDYLTARIKPPHGDRARSSSFQTA